MSKQRLEAEVTVTVPFHDIDLMSVVWHGYYAKYMEIARCEMLKKIDYDYLQMSDSDYVWPIIDTRVRYSKPLRYDQKVKVKCWMVEWENRFKISYLLSDAKTGQRLAKATTVQVAVNKSNGEMCFESPPVLIEKLKDYL